jgi:HD-GYP domain-containing protein (c-di-GMP phosphodiesterase class II)
MEIAMDSLCIMFSKAFDIIEAELAGVSERHSLRVAALCAKMGRKSGYNDDALSALFFCALFHDNALTEYTLAQRLSGYSEIDLAPHCEYGQRNVEWLPFKKNIDGYILHHHSCENGTGPFGVREFPHEAALIGAADMVDVMNNLQRVSPGDLNALRDNVAASIGKFSTKSALEKLLDILDRETLESLRDENIHDSVRRLAPSWRTDMKDESVLRLAQFIAYIIDCKSRFTRKHTEQIANRAWFMGGYYNYSREEKTKLYLAAALHDIGKIATPSLVLEKPDKLDKEEYKVIMEHVRYTHEWLSEVEGLEEIHRWACEHHEKLDGTGYPLQKSDTELDFNSRLLACIDIYQAVCEERPYHPARSHSETMPILYDMADKGFIDKKIVKDLDEVMVAGYSLSDLPPPTR